MMLQDYLIRETLHFWTDYMHFCLHAHADSTLSTERPTLSSPAQNVSFCSPAPCVPACFPLSTMFAANMFLHHRHKEKFQQIS